MNGTYSSHTPEIDGLRAVAVLSVMAFHLDQTYLPGGFTGVDIFFVISGYVVSKSLTERLYQGAGAYILEFYQRRIVRVFPALLVMLVLVSILTILFVPGSWLSDKISVTGLSAFFGVSNIILAFFNETYFAPRTDFNPFVHTWSLGVEEQFYVVFPLLFLFWNIWRHRQGVKRQLAWLILPAVAIASLVCAWFFSANKPDWAFYLLPGRFWELAVGAILYQWHTTGRLLPSSERCAGKLLWLGLALCLAGFLWADRAQFPYPWALLPVSGTLLIISAVRFRRRCGSPGHRFLRHPGTVYVGRISYSLYLWHWPVYSLMRWTTGLESYPEQALALIATALLSVVSFHFIERGAQNLARAAPLHSATKVMAGLASVVVLFVITRGLFQHQSQLSLSVTRDTYNWYSHDHPVTDPGDAGRPFAGRQLFVIGNSHAPAYATMLHEAQQRLGVTVHLRNFGDCAMAQIVRPSARRPDCEAAMLSMMALLEGQARPGDIVFFASLRAYRLVDQWVLYDIDKLYAYSNSGAAVAEVVEAREDASRLIDLLEALELWVVIDLPKPVLNAPVFRCSDWFNAGNPVCERGPEVEKALLLQMRARVVDSLAELRGRHSNLVLWDPFPTLCPGEICTAFDRQALPLFFDGDHLSGHGNRVLYPEFADLLEGIWHKKGKAGGASTSHFSPR